MKENFEYFEGLRQKMEEDSQIKIAYTFRKAKKNKPLQQKKEIPQKVQVKLEQQKTGSFKMRQTQGAGSFKSKKPESQLSGSRKAKGGDPNMMRTQTNQTQSQFSEHRNQNKITSKKHTMKSSNQAPSVQADKKSQFDEEKAKGEEDQEDKKPEPEAD